MSRIGVPRTVITVLEGESLVNDASALVLYRAAVVAIVSGTFSIGATIGSFFVVATVGILVGFAAGWLTRWAVRHMSEGYGQIALTLLGPYVAWIAAERLHGSAVLACVVGGIYVRQHFSAEVSPLVRLQSRSVWELLIFMLNGVIFILIGLQLGPLRRTLPEGSIGPGAAVGRDHHAHRDHRPARVDAGGCTPGSDRPEVPREEPAAARSCHLHRGLDRHARHRVTRHRAGAAAGSARTARRCRSARRSSSSPSS